MVLGTSSGAGKSLMTTALCRHLRQRGEQPVPFKGQNMSLNAWVDGNGGEMAYSQAVQAWAAGLEPQAAMNPVLLKPRGDSTSEVIHMGRSVGSARAEHYYRDWFRPGWQAIRQGLQHLEQGIPGGRLVLEGAGSPVEVNLQARDLTNLRLAQYLRARCVLVADIERGGVFAQIVGTLSLLRPVERPLIRGVLINRFRGRRSLFDEGRLWLERNTGLPVLGVMPWLDDLFPPEDSLDLLERRGRKNNAEIRIAVLKLPSLSNFSDLDPLETERTVQLDWVGAGESLGPVDAVIVPGSKQTLRDLAALRQAGLDQELRAYGDAGGMIFGLCGGLQMLGRWLDDPDGLEGGLNSKGSSPRTAGLDLLPLSTRFVGSKELRQRQVESLWPPGSPLTLEGFELHHGTTTLDLDPREMDGQPLGEVPELMTTDPRLGWWQPRGERGGLVAGTYLHGVFDNGPWRRRWLNLLRDRRGLPPLSLNVPHHRQQRDRLLERLADVFAQEVNLEPLLDPQP